MTTRDLISQFCTWGFNDLLAKVSKRDLKAASLRVTVEGGGLALYSYSTVIARRFSAGNLGEFSWVNTTKYSVTTSKAQSRLYLLEQSTMTGGPEESDPKTLSTFLVKRDEALEKAQPQCGACAAIGTSLFGTQMHYSGCRFSEVRS